MNNITITYGSGVHHVVTDPLYQGDYGQQITFAGIDGLPASFEVHFSNEASKGISTRSIGLDSVVDIPNMYLQTGEVSIYGWVFLHDPATSGETEYTFRIPVKKKPAADPVIPTPPQEDVIAQAINAINGSAEDAAQSATDAQTAQGLAEDARDAAQAAQGLAETAQGKAEDAQEAAETAQGKAETAQGKAEDAQSAAEAQAVLAESYAKGGTNTRTGENTDNAKYYAEQSAGSASTASGYVTDAQGYASDASGYTNDAKDYKNAAGDYATEAYGYKNDASGSASEASGYANDAKGYKNDASGYASDASGYATAASGSATAAEAEALKAEGYAINKQNGENVGAGSPYYHNSAKYFASQAQNHAGDAGTEALKAEGFAVGKQNGSAVSSGSPYYQNNAEYYAGQAADSATSAATSAATFETDTTLSVAGKAADAKKTGDEISDLKSHISPIEDVMPMKETTAQGVLYDGMQLKDIVINGATTGIYDGMAIIDGVNIKVTSLNGNSGGFNYFFISAGQINKANGSDNFVCDWLPTNMLNEDRVTGRTNSSAVEISLSTDKCNYTIDAANTYLQSHPIRIWYVSPDFAQATAFYPFIKCTGTKYFVIGTTQAIPVLGVGDTLSLATGEINRGGVVSTVGISDSISKIWNGALITTGSTITVVEYLALDALLDNKVNIDGWNEVTPINTTFFDGLNYFDLSNSTVYNDRFVDSNGKITSASSLTSVVFPVKPDTTYWFYTAGMNRFFVVESDSAIFNIDSTYTVLHNSSETVPTEFTTGHNAKYVCAYIANYTYDFTQNIPVLNEKVYSGARNPYISREFLPDEVSSLRNVNVLIFGDSITDTCNFTINASDETTAVTWKNPSNSYVDAGGNTIMYNMWPKMLKDLGVCAEVRNYARSGASYQDAERTSGEERQNLSYQITVALNDLDNPNDVFVVDDFVPDIVIFALGTNDGEPDDTYDDAMAKTVLKSDGYSIDTTATLANLDMSKFCESVRSAFMRTRIAFPYAQFYCVLPIQRANNETNGGDLNTDLRHMARRYGCVIIDGYAESGIIRDTNVWNSLGSTLKDGLHPNDKGQNMMFRMIYSALRSNYIKSSVMNP